MRRRPSRHARRPGQNVLPRLPHAVGRVLPLQVEGRGTSEQIVVEIVYHRRYPDRDEPKLVEHVVDQPAYAAATAVRKSPAGSGAGGDDLLAQRYDSRICELIRSSRNVVARLPLSFAIFVGKYEP